MHPRRKGGADRGLVLHTFGQPSGIGYDASASLQDGTLVVNRAGPVILQGKLSHVLSITQAVVTATVTAPDQSKTSLVLKDDGVFPDLKANDGTYTTSYLQKGKGIYTANLRFSNEGLTARETYGGAIFSPTVTGEIVSSPADVAVPAKFVRNQEIQFTVNTDILTQAPVIAIQPSNQNVLAGASVTIPLSAQGIPAPTFQWQRLPSGTSTWANVANGGAYANATTDAFAITGVTAAMSGDQFRCVVTNSVASVTSNAVTLSVGALATISTQPSNRTIAAGGSTTFAVVATGTPVPALQWQYQSATMTYWATLTDGGGYAGTATATLAINGVDRSLDNLRYRCAVTNAFGTIYSAAATLSVSGTGAAPTLTTQPANQVAAIGQTATFTVAAAGASPLTYQWSRNGTALPGATSTLLTLAAVQTAHAGSYTVTVSNGFGSVTSNPATLTVNSPIAISTQPQAQAVVNGGTLVLSVAVSGGSSATTYQWRLNGTPIPGATAATYNAPGLGASGAGTYDVLIRDGSTSLTSAPVVVTIVPVSRIANLSILTNVRTADPFFTVGTVIGGAGTSGSKTLLVRAAGPSLAQLGVSGALPDPMLNLYAGQTLMSSNDNWGGTTTLAAMFTQVGAFAYMASNSRDAAVYNPSMPAGSYTVQISGVAGTTGTVIAELYDATPSANFTLATPRLVNVSVLKQINPGEILTAGFVLAGTTPKTVLVRAVGPTLASAPFNVSGAMADPRVELFSGQAVTASNDNWGTPVGPGAPSAPQITAVFAQVGAFALPTGSRDAALLVTLAPGNYTAQVSGVGNTGGLAIVEVYEVP